MLSGSSGCSNSASTPSPYYTFDRRSFRLGQLNNWSHASRGGHIYQRVQREQVDLAAHEVGDTWLGDTEQLSGFCLRDLLRLNQPSRSKPLAVRMVGDSRYSSP